MVVQNNVIDTTPGSTKGRNLGPTHFNKPGEDQSQNRCQNELKRLTCWMVVGK